MKVIIGREVVGAVRSLCLKSLEKIDHLDAPCPRLGGHPGVDDYFKLFDTNINKLIEAFKKAGVEPKPLSN